MSSHSTADGTDGGGTDSRRTALIAFTWLWVAAPLAYGLYELLQKAAKLFTG